MPGPSRHLPLAMSALSAGSCLAALLLTQLPANGKAVKYHPSVGPLCHVGDPEEASDCWLWPGQSHLLHLSAEQSS